MTDKDKARQKLVESMRKTKAATGPTARKKVKKKSAARRPPANRKPKSGAMPAKTKNRQPGTVMPDPYQSSGRVWPD